MHTFEARSRGVGLARTSLLPLLFSVAAAAQGQQTLTWDSSQWVPPINGAQPVNGWHFFAYTPDDSHDQGDMRPLAWDASGLTVCGIDILPDGWVLPGDPCCNIVQPISGPFEFEQSASARSSVRAWQAPTSGSVRITTPNGNVRKPAGSNGGGDGSGIRIWRNDLRIFERHLAPTDTTGFPIDETITVNAGDWLWFHNDPGANTVNDRVVFQPFLALTLGPGYDPAPFTKVAAVDFATNPLQGQNGWTYEAFAKATNTYAQMPSLCNDATGRHWRNASCAAVETCRVWSDRQHPSGTHDSVRVWTAPQDGFVMLRSRSDVRRPASGEPVVVQVRHQTPSRTFVLWQETIDDAVGVPLGAYTHLRAGDRIAIHAASTVANPLSSEVVVDLELTLHPMGEFARPMITHPGSVVIQSPTFWFYERHQIHGDLTFASSRLWVQDSTVELMNTYEGQFDYRFQSGELRTVSAVIGGGSTTADVMHSNFEFHHSGLGRWTTKDTVVQNTYGQLLIDPNAPSILSGSGHKAGPHGDLIHLGSKAQVTLSDSEYRFRLLFPANNPNPITATLPVGSPTTLSLGSAQFPGVDWTLSLTNTEVPIWDLAAYDMLSGPVTKTVTVNDVAELYAEMAGRNLVGDAVPFRGTLTRVPTGPGELAVLDTFNVRWRAGAFPSQLHLWACYFDGPATDLRLHGGGPSYVAELFCWDGARVAYLGTPGTYDAECQATVIRCFDQGQLTLRDGALGTTYTLGLIEAANNAQIVIDHCKVVAPIAVRALNNSHISVFNMTDADWDKLDKYFDGTSSIIRF